MSIINDIDIEKIDLDQKIDEITFFTVNTKISSGKMHGQSHNIKPLGYVTVKVNGFTGISEIYAATYISIGLKSIFKYLEYHLKNKTLIEIIEILDSLSIPFVSRNGIFKASIGSLENAVLDLCAKMQNIPLFKLFNINKGHKYPKIYASGGSVICTKEEIGIESTSVYEDGYDGYKIRAGLQSWNNDMERILAIDNNIKYKMVDAICGTRVPCWTYDEALSKIPFLEDNNIYWLEEPLYPDNYLDYAKLQKATNINVAAGEAYSGFGELKNLVDIGQIGIIQFDACHSGGFSVSRNISNYALQNNKKTAIHVWGSAVAIHTNFHLALCLEDLDFLEKPLIELEIDSLIGKRFSTLDNLKNLLLEKPGIGIDIEDFNNVKVDDSFGFEYKW